MDRHRVVTVIPAYNEVGTIGDVVSVAKRYTEVLVVDDCSSDGTKEAAEAAGAQVVRNARNLGYGETLNRGFDAALEERFEWIITIDADGEHDPSFLAPFVDALVDRRVPIVLGVRPRKQRLSEVLMGYYVKWRFGARDILCGMKGYRADLVEANGGFDTSNSIGTELALNSIRRGSSFVEIAINGTRRLGAPRFNRRLRANLVIFAALGQLIRRDISLLPGRFLRS